jgi:hypothetical protein
MTPPPRSEPPPPMGSDRAVSFRAHMCHPPPQAAWSPLSPRRCGPLMKRSHTPLPFPALTLSAAPLAIVAAEKPPRQASPEPPRVVPWHRAAGRQATPWSEPMSSPSAFVSTSPWTGRSGPHRCILGLPPHHTHLTGISNRVNSRLMDPSLVPPSGRSCVTAGNHVGSDYSSTSDQIEFHAHPACPSA